MLSIMLLLLFLCIYSTEGFYWSNLGAIRFSQRVIFASNIGEGLEKDDNKTSHWVPQKGITGDYDEIEGEYNFDSNSDYDQMTKEDSDVATSQTSSVVDKLSAEVTKYRMRASLLEQALDTQKSKLGVMEGAVVALESANEAAQARIIEGETKASSQAELLTNLQEENFGLQSDLADYRVRLTQVIAAERAARAAADNYRSEVSSLGVVAEEAEEVKAAANEESARYRDRALLLEDSIKKTRGRYASLEAQLSDTTARLEELTHEHITLRGEASAAAVQVVILKKENAALIERVSLAKEEARVAENTLCQALAEVEELKLALTAHEAERKRAKPEANRDEELDYLTQEVERLRANIYGGASGNTRGRPMSNNAGGVVPGGMDYLIAGDLRDQRRILEQQTVVLTSLLAAIEGRNGRIGRGLVTGGNLVASRRILRLPRLGVVSAARRLFASRSESDPIGALSQMDVLQAEDK